MFNEQAYLAGNPDVAAAVASGDFRCGEEHFSRFGRHEGRSAPAPNEPPAPPRARRDMILEGLDLAVLRGVEIGALDKPLARREDGEIFYIDFSDAETIAAKYRDEPTVNIDNLVSIDGIWGAQSLEQCVGGQVFDYVVASHVIEHVPDLVTWLQEIESVLTVDGQLRLAIPDRRFTFDIARSETTIYDVLAAYVERRRTPSAHALIECHSLMRFVCAHEAWDGTLDLDAPKHASTTERGMTLARDTLATGTYHDVHCWVVTPTSFTNLMLALARLGLLGFECSSFQTTRYHELEFFAHLKRQASQAVIIESWEAAAAKAR